LNHSATNFPQFRAAADLHPDGPDATLIVSFPRGNDIGKTSEEDAAA